MIGLFIGRFQPFHNGHLEVVKQMAEECDSVIIGVGSAQKEHEMADPLSGGERIYIIEKVLNKKNIVPFRVYPVPDIECYPAWVHYVKSILPNFDRVYGNSSVVLKLFESSRIETKRVDEVKREIYSGSEIRKRIREGKKWKHLVPHEVADYLEEINVKERIKPVIGMNDETEKEVAHLLTKKGLTVATVESCTGGLISHRLTNIPGSSSYFMMGLVTYSNQSKIELVEVDENTLDEKGAVSSEVAKQMAEGVREKADTDLGMATTGIAGPGGGSKEKPVGTVYMGLSTPQGTYTEKYHFSGNRWQVKEQTSEKALQWIIKYLEKL
ncbi:MAG: nicotinamide-nucleotide adenylyltransferase [Thermoplasmatota archaeon]